MPEVFKNLEFGCELAFMKANGAKSPTAGEVEGEKTQRYSTALGEFRVTLDVGVQDKKPRSIVVDKKGRAFLSLRYVSWVDGLEPDLNLFRVPEGIEIQTNPQKP